MNIFFFYCDRQQRVVVNELNQIGPPFCQVSSRALFLGHCYSRCT